MPPCTSLVDLLLVPLAKSAFLSRPTLKPCAAASRATPAPVIPPPMTRMSTPELAISRSAALRWRYDSSCIAHFPFGGCLLPIWWLLTAHLVVAHCPFGGCLLPVR